MEYTERKALHELLSEYRKTSCMNLMLGDFGAGMRSAFKACNEIVSDAPAADVAPVVHGRWVWHLGEWVSCSECHTIGSPQWKGCPVCLARMDGE